MTDLAKPKSRKMTQKARLGILKTARQMSQDLKVNPLEVLLHFANNDWAALGYDSECQERIADGGMVLEMPHITPKMRLDAAKEAIKYLYPTLKATEVKVTQDPKFKDKPQTYEEYIILKTEGRRKALRNKEKLEEAEVVPYDLNKLIHTDGGKDESKMDQAPLEKKEPDTA